MMSIQTLKVGAFASLTAAVLTACSGGGGDVAPGPAINLTTARGTLVANPPHSGELSDRHRFQKRSEFIG